MDYFKILNLDKEPFSNSPDPELFFESKQHLECLQKIEIALRLKRGVNLVIGDVGAGKTTLCRKLISRLVLDKDFECHLILDPGFTSELDFAKEIAVSFGGVIDPDNNDERKIKETIKQLLFKKGVDQNKSLVLIIDEGQKLPLPCLELLRELLNFETNRNKLLQIVIFAQQEIKSSLKKLPNFTDRINLQHFLGPMSYKDSRDMIRFRVKQACNRAVPPELFSRLALFRIHGFAKGRPRKIINICHQCLLAMIIQNRSKIGWRLAVSSIKRSMPDMKNNRFSINRAGIPVLAILAAMAFFVFNSNLLPVNFDFGVKDKRIASPKVMSFSIPFNKEVLPPAGVANHKNDTKSPATIVDHGNHDNDPEKELPLTTPVSTEKIIQGDNRNSTIGLAAAAPPEAKVENLLYTASNNPPEKPVVLKPVAPPDIIGSLEVNKYDTLGNMIKNIYGVYKTIFIESVLEINPRIKNPDSVEKGDIIRFPTMGKNFRPSGNSYHWISVDSAASLQEAMQKLKFLKPAAPPLRIVASWHPETKSDYQIFVKGYFLDNRSALNLMGQLPAHLSEKARVISDWPEDCVVFSDLFIGGIL